MLAKMLRRGGVAPYVNLLPAQPQALGQPGALAEADRLRGECDIYVDNKLAEFEEFLNGTIRSVSRGRHQLRTAAGTHDYATR